MLDMNRILAPRLDAGPFDIVVCQLVISIIGAIDNRMNLLRHMRANLRPGGWLAVSASGVSDTINPGYARLYAADEPLTGERHTYFSRTERETSSRRPDEAAFFLYATCRA